MCDILYVLGSKSKWDNNELRYSLRSIEKFGKNVGRIFVVGFDPGFLSDKVICLPCEDSYIRKQKNILEKIQYAVDNSDISENFLLSSDDHFYVKETDFDKYPYFCKGELPLTIDPKAKNKGYLQSLVDTRRILNRYGYTHFNFSFHGNTHMTKTGVKQARRLIEASYRTRNGCEPTCLILNVIYSKHPFLITKRGDLKVGNIANKEELIKKIGNREVFSIYDNSIECGVAEYLQELFPNKSIYEK